MARRLDRVQCVFPVRSRRGIPFQPAAAGVLNCGLTLAQTMESG
jgi:hypothetical protein